MKTFKAKTIEQLREDIVDTKIAEDRLEEIKKGKAVTKTKEEFLKEMRAWSKSSWFRKYGVLKVPNFFFLLYFCD